MKSTKATKTQNLSAHLLTTLDLFDHDGSLKGPKGDEFHHLQEVHVLKGDDNYNITAVTSIAEDSINSQSIKMSAPTRLRNMSGVSLVFWSELGYVWTKNLFFHKGCMYEQDIITQENVDMDEQGNLITE